MSEHRADDAAPSRGTGTSERKMPSAGIALWWTSVGALLVLMVVGVAMGLNESQNRGEAGCFGQEHATFTVTASDDGALLGTDVSTHPFLAFFEGLVGDDTAQPPCSVDVSVKSAQIDDAEERYDLINLTVEDTTCTYQTRAGDLQQSVCDWVPVPEGSHTAEAVRAAVDAEIPDDATWDPENVELAGIEHLRIENLEHNTENDA